MGMLGCFADGIHVECRHCGGGVYSSIPCSAGPGPSPTPPDNGLHPGSEVCQFPNEPVTRYYFDEECEMGKLGCNADGLHVGCRFCGDGPDGAYKSIPCPSHEKQLHASVQR